jgi:hypothetical protein
MIPAENIKKVHVIELFNEVSAWANFATSDLTKQEQIVVASVPNNFNKIALKSFSDSNILLSKNNNILNQNWKFHILKSFSDKKDFFKKQATHSKIIVTSLC